MKKIIHAGFVKTISASVSDNGGSSDIFRPILQLVRSILHMCGNHVSAHYLLSKSIQLIVCTCMYNRA